MWKLRRLVVADVLTFWAVFIAAVERNCAYVNRNEKLKADCSNLGFKIVPSNLNTSIGILDLSHNNLTLLPNNTFAQYSNLIVLFIDDNQLNFVHGRAFSGLDKLEILSMKRNNLDLSTAYANDVFRFLPKLVSLDIRRNSEKSSQKTTPIFYPYFGSLDDLKILNIDLVANPVFNTTGLSKSTTLEVLRFDSCNVLNMMNTTFLGLSSHVQFIYFKGCINIYKIETDCLRPFSQLKGLSLHHTYIHLSRALNILYPLQNKTMKTISFKRVTSSYQDSSKYPYAVKVTKEMMRYLQTICVENLVLSENGIVDFESGSLLTYDHPECFKQIILSGNRFTILTGVKIREFLNLKPRLTRIKIFDFSFNPIKYNDITYVNGDKNYLSAIPYESLQEQFIDLFHNNTTHTVSRKENTITFEPMCESIENDRETKLTITFTLPPSLEILRLSHNLDLPRKIDKLIIENASNLTILDISYFQTSFFPDVAIKGVNKLRYLDVSGIDSTLYSLKQKNLLFKYVETVVAADASLGRTLAQNENIFQLVPNVEVLNITKNALWYLPFKAFSHNYKIKRLILTLNTFKEIPLAITKLPHLEYLDVRFNYLQTINRTMQNWIDQQHNKVGSTFKLLMSGNILMCSCDTKDFIRWIFETNVQLDKKRRNFLCRLSNGTETNTLKVYNEFHEIFSHCNSEIWLRVGIGCLVSIVALTVPIAVIYNFRLKLAIFIYRKFRRVVEHGYKQKFKYDVYVSYAEDSATWVKNILAPKIESSWGMKMHIGDRDLLAGEICSDAIAQAIHGSRHAFLIISSGLKDSIWASFERDRVKYEKYANNLQRIVVIARKVSVEHFPADLDTALKDISLIEWNEMDCEIGWDKLRLILFSESF